MTAALLLALTAGMLGAVNPCGFALLPAYLSLLVAGASDTRGAVGRALTAAAGLTVGYVLVFGAFGLALAPLAGWLRPRLPWLTVTLGVLLAVAGCWLLAGRRLPSPGWSARAPRLTRSWPSMVLFGAAYALASLGCAIAPFLAIVVTSLQAGSTGQGWRSSARTPSGWVWSLRSPRSAWRWCATAWWRGCASPARSCPDSVA